MKLLAIDTAANLCAACVYDTAAAMVTGREVLDIGKGHAEQLLPVIERAMREAGAGYPDLGAIAVSVGPGSFTGVRVGVAAARGLALALKLPAIGVTTLGALAAETREKFGAVTVLAALDAGRGEIHAAIYNELAMTVYGPAVVTLEDAAGLARQHAATLAGSAAAMIAAVAGRELDIGSGSATAGIRHYAMLAAAQGPGAERPKPVYLRQADAKPQAGFVLPREGR